MSIRTLQLYKKRAKDSYCYYLYYELLKIGFSLRTIHCIRHIVEFNAEITLKDIFKKLSTYSKEELLSFANIGPGTFSEIKFIIQRECGKTPVSWRMNKCKHCGQILKS